MSFPKADPQISAIEVLPFAPDHIPGALALSQKVGWPHRYEDWQLIVDLSSGFAAVCDGRVVGTAFSTRFNEHMSANNMIIVEAAMQGQGLGRRLMQAILALTPGTEIRLVSTREGRPLYEKLGFVPMGAIFQHQAVTPEGVQPLDPSVNWIESPDLAMLTQMDARAFGGERQPVIRAVLDLGHAFALRRDGRIAGFGVLRPFGRGEVVGPVIAETARDAKALISFAMSERPGIFLRADVTEASGLSDWLSDLGLSKVDAALAMSTRPGVAAPEDGLESYALISQALG